ncbi:MAG: zf-TFIIB domain-containing protein [Peptococcaceae bacterium]|nr:zf-TFIIB domain-containing protein [Peptococcaceae bacterium]
MLCPKCKGIDMMEVSKEGVIIDVCPQCRGVWLDRGELEKILEAGRAVRDYDEVFGNKESHRYREKEYADRRHYEYDHYKKHRKKKSFFDMFEDIFD